MTEEAGPQRISGNSAHSTSAKARVESDWVEYWAGLTLDEVHGVDGELDERWPGALGDEGETRYA